MFQGSVVVTGCDSGLGLSLCSFLPRHGFFVIATCKSEEGLLEAYKSLCDDSTNKYDTGVHNQSRSYVCINGACFLVDITSGMDVEAFHKKVMESTNNKSFPPLYALINNAGIWRCSLLEDAMHSIEKGNEEIDLWKEVMDTNFFGTLRMTLAFTKELKHSSAGGAPRVVFISSVLDRHSMPGQGAYVASKFAVGGLHETLCHEFVDKAVVPIIVRPGALGNTRLFHRDLQLDDPDYKQDIKSSSDILRSSYRLLLNFAGDCNAVAQRITEILLEKKPRLEYSDITGSVPFRMTEYFPKKLFIQLVRFVLYSVGGIYSSVRRILTDYANFINSPMMQRR